MAVSKRSVIWAFFSQIERAEKCKCNACAAEISSQHGDTTNAATHLRLKHSKKHKEMMLLKKREQESKELKLKHTAPKITNFVQDKQNFAKYHQDSSRHKELCQYVACMLAVDMRPISKVKDVGFKALVMNLDSKFELPSRIYICAA